MRKNNRPNQAIWEMVKELAIERNRVRDLNFVGMRDSGKACLAGDLSSTELSRYPEFADALVRHEVRTSLSVHQKDELKQLFEEFDRSARYLQANIDYAIVHGQVPIDMQTIWPDRMGKARATANRIEAIVSTIENDVRRWVGDE